MYGKFNYINMKHDSLMIKLMEKHNLLYDLIGSDNIHYVDLPVYGNIGDLLIMMGTLSFVKKTKINIKVKAAYFNYNVNWAKKKI